MYKSNHAISCSRFSVCASLFGLLYLNLFPPSEAQNQNFLKIIEPKRKALRDVNGVVQRQFQKTKWCEASSTCDSSEDDCLFFGCSGNVPRDEATCNTEFFNTKPCNNRDENYEGGHEDMCSAFGSDKPNGTRIWPTQPMIRLPNGVITAEGNNKSILIGAEKYLLLKRDVCALKGIGNTLVNAYENNKLRHWLYIGTANNAAMKIPGSSECRGSTDPILECGYDAAARPWYITASSGPRDVIFLVDRTSIPFEGTRLRLALKEAVERFDTRDMVSVVTFGGNENSVLLDDDGDELLTNMTTDRINALRSEIDNIRQSNSAPSNYTTAFEKAFRIFNKTETERGSTNCNKFIVLFAGKQDTCFERCREGQPCKCVSSLMEYIKRKQNEAETEARIVTFIDNVEGMTLSHHSDVERMSKSISCTNSSSGVSYRVSAFDTEENATLALYQLSALTVFSDNAETFSSDIYEDFSGLGQMFTISLPVYAKQEQNTELVAVIAADITVDEVQETFNDRNEAIKQIQEYARATRGCLEPRPRNGCELQVLRSKFESRCAPVLQRSTTSSCFMLNNELLVQREEELTYEEAMEACRNMSSGGSLITIPDKNDHRDYILQLLASDGSWIGMTASVSGSLIWADGTDSDYDNFGYNFTTALQEMEIESACVAADRRSTSGNWDVLPCNSKRKFICQFNYSNVTSSRICQPREETMRLDEDVNPTNCNPEDSSVRRDECSDEQDEQLRKADPLCRQVGKDDSEEERTCCAAAKKFPAYITGVIVGVSLVCSVFVFFLITRLCVVWPWVKQSNRARLICFPIGEHVQKPKDEPSVPDALELDQDEIGDHRNSEDDIVTTPSTLVNQSSRQL